MEKFELSGRIRPENCKLNRLWDSKPPSSQGERESTEGYYFPHHQWIAEQLKVKLSQYSNDTLFHKNLMNRFYHKYSSSQDYYYRNHISNILGDQITPAVINWFDIETMLDQDEYFKRFYAVHEYDNKIALLSEYYKFHKDIPRMFSLPACKLLNRYHDQKRKIDYHNIKRMLIEEAKKKNKKVAMNEDDNEIRLTDGDVHPSNEGNQDGEEEQAENEDSSSVDFAFNKNSKILPEHLLHSLYRAEGHRMPKNKVLTEASSDTIALLNEKLGHLCKGLNNDHSSFTSFDLTKSDWEKNYEPGHARDMRSSGKYHNLIGSPNEAKDQDLMSFKPINLKLNERTAKNVKDVNLNINLNLRLLKEQISSSSEYNCFAPLKHLRLKANETCRDQKPSSDFKRITKAKRLATESNNDFKKKTKADELRASSKDQSIESRLLRKTNQRSKRLLIDSEHSLSQKRLLVMPQIPVTKLQMHTFSKFMKDMGGEYKKATGKTVKLRKSRNLENILVKYKPLQDKTPDIDSARKESSEKKGNFTTRSRANLEKCSKSRGTLASSRGLDKLGMNRNSREKLNFKKKKLSLQQVHHQSSKEISRHGLNMDAANLYQTNPLLRSKRQVSSSHRMVDPIDLIKDKYNGSISARTKPTTGENSILQNVVNNVNTKLGKHKLSLSNSIGQHNHAPPKLFSLNVGTQANPNQLECKESKPSKSRKKRESRSKSTRGAASINPVPIAQLQSSKFAKLMNKEMKKKTVSPEGMKKSFADPLSHRAASGRERFGSPLTSKDRNKASFATFKMAGHAFAVEKMPTYHGYSKSEISKIPVIFGQSSAQPSSFKASLCASRVPSMILQPKIPK